MTLDVRAVLRLVRKSFILLIILTLVGGLAGYYLSSRVVAPMYEASVMLVVNTRDEQVTVITSDQINSARQLVNTYAVILTNDALLDELIEHFELDSDIPTLKNRISAEAVNQTQVMRMTVRDRSSDMALELLEFIIERAPELLIETVKAGSVEIVSPPRANYDPVSPSIYRYTAVGALAGLFAALAFVFIKKALINTIVSDDDVGKYLDLPVLGVVPKIKQ